jgi:two-component system sensor histidine kinase ArlS
MQIRTRLTLLFTLITAAIFLGFAFVVYYSASENRQKEFYSLLKKEAITKANLFINAKVESETLQDIYLSNRQTLNEVEVAIYDTTFQLLYHDAVDIDFVKETDDMLKKTYEKGWIEFYQKDWQVVGLRYSYGDHDYIITATAYDKYGYNELSSLLRNCVLVFLLSVVAIYISGTFFSKKAFDPVRRMTENVKRISATNLDMRLTSNRSKDELAELADTFNEMLERLEQSFEAQKRFVSNISHELRTPLAAIITELELSSVKDHSPEEYRSAIRYALQDTRRLVRLSNSLLDLAKASYDPMEIAMRPVRADEVLLDARHQLQLAKKDYKIDIHFDTASFNGEDDNELSVYGNEYLLKVLFINLFENGCKFSDNKQSGVSVSFSQNKLMLDFSDKGIGIPADDIENIFTPFFRGKNKKIADGHGVGLSLVQRIIQLHNGEIQVVSKPDLGTSVLVTLPTVSLL